MHKVHHQVLLSLFCFVLLGEHLSSTVSGHRTYLGVVSPDVADLPRVVQNVEENKSEGRSTTGQRCAPSLRP
jgi:hypothetical protein